MVNLLFTFKEDVTSSAMEGKSEHNAFFTLKLKQFFLTSSTIGGSYLNSHSKPHSFSYMLEVASFGVLDLDMGMIVRILKRSN